MPSTTMGEFIMLENSRQTKFFAGITPKAYSGCILYVYIPSVKYDSWLFIWTKKLFFILHVFIYTSNQPAMLDGVNWYF